MPSFKGILLETALTLWLIDLCSNRTFFYNKNQIREMEEANCSAKSAVNSLRNNEPQAAQFILLHMQSVKV